MLAVVVVPNLLPLSTTNDSHLYRLFPRWMVRIYWARLYQSIGHLLLRVVHVGEVEVAVTDNLKAPPPSCHIIFIQIVFGLFQMMPHHWYFSGHKEK